MRKPLSLFLALWLAAFFAAAPALALTPGQRVALFSGGAPAPLYLFCTEEQYPTDKHSLVIFSSPDGKSTFIDTKATYTGTTDAVRDCTLFNDLAGASGKLWMFHTNCDPCVGGPATTTFDIAYATNGAACIGGHVACRFVYQQSVSCGNLVSGSTALVVTPKPFVDPANGNFYLTAIASNTGTGDTGFQPAYTYPTDRAGLTTWANCTYITGTSLPANMLDDSIITSSASGSLLYYFWLKDETSKDIDLFISSSPFTGYVAQGTANWAGWGSGNEASAIIPLDTSGERWRIYYAAYNTHINYYSETYDLFQTWTTPVSLASVLPWFGDSDWMLTPPLPAPAPWTPLSLGPALVAWYDAGVGVTQSGGTASAWADQGPHGVNLTSPSGHQPAYGGTGCGGGPGMTFDAASTYFTSAAGAVSLPLWTARMSAFAAGNMLTGTKAYGRLVTSLGNAPGNSVSDVNNNKTSTFLVRNNSTNAIEAQDGNVNLASMAVSLATNSEFGMTFGYLLGASTITISSYLNGVFQASGTHNYPNPWGTGSSPWLLTLAIGADLSTNSSGVLQAGALSGWWGGTECEIIITQDTLTPQDIASWQTYRVNKQGF